MVTGPRTRPDALTAAVIRLADGDRSAFDEVYDRVGPRVDAVCARILGPGPDAEDAAQQALVRIVQQVHAFDPTRGEAIGWILTTAAWEARTARRRRGRRREGPLGPEDALPAAAQYPDAGAELRALVQLLEPADQELVLASVGDGPRPDTTPAAFRKRLQRAVARLRDAVAFEPAPGRKK